MIAKIVAGWFAVVCSVGAANAQNCGAYPITLTNGTNADATQVMQNFNAIRTCVNSPPASFSVPGLLVGATTNDTGTVGTMYLRYPGGMTASGLIIKPTTNPVNVATVAFTNATNSIVGYIFADATSTVYMTSSDKTLKFDERPFMRAREVIDLLQVWDFAWRADPNKRGVGVFAQDAQKVWPDPVRPSELQGGWGIDYSRYVPVLIADAQATHRTVDDLLRRIEALERRIK